MTNSKLSIEPWEDKVKENAMRCLGMLDNEFKKGFEASITHIPENNSENRAIALNLFVDMLVGLLVKKVTEYGSSAFEVEDAVCAGVRYKFEHLRGEST